MTTLLEQAQAASWKVNELFSRARHSWRCPKAFMQTDEFACTCEVGDDYRFIRKVLIDAGKLEERIERLQRIVVMANDYLAPNFAPLEAFKFIADDPLLLTEVKQAVDG